MVQRKAPDKLGIQADSKNYASKTLKPSSSSQHPDVRSKGGGPELKKKMKKSRSFKRSDLESLGSYPERRAKSRFDKPTTDEIVAAATPPKPSLIKIPDASPNYMKSTSSSNARKERSQVSPASSKASDCKSSNSRKSNYMKLCSSYGHKQLRTLTKTTSLKPVRTLTKTSSGKGGRPSMKKSSGVAMYPNQNISRATCSSTLKDSKFPAYVMLHPGGTESEGTSVMKVCPYTYCSLNGHHHAPLPPLKCFLSARRRFLRTQKSMRLKGLSQVKIRSEEERNKEIDTGQMVFSGDPVILEADVVGSAISPLIDEVGLDFFVEIYAKPRENTNGNDEAKVDFVENSPEVLEDISFLVNDGGESEIENYFGRVEESLPDESSHSEISFEDNLEQNSDFNVTEMDTLMDFTEHVRKEEVEDTFDPPCFMQEETDVEEDQCNGSESESDVSVESELDESISETTDMDWEEGQVVDPRLDNGLDHSTLSDDESDLISVCSNGPAETGLHDELFIESDDTISNCCEEVSEDVEELQVVSGENRESFDAEFGNGDFELDGEDTTSKIDFSCEISTQKPSLQDHLSSTKDTFEEPKAISEGKDGDHEKDFIYSCVFSASDEYPLEESTAASEENYEVSEPENDFLRGHTLLRDDKLTCTDDEHKSIEDEFKMNQVIVPEDPHIDAAVGCQIQEPKDVELKYKVQTSEFVDAETNQGVAASDLKLDQVLTSAIVGDEAEEKEQIEDANELLGIQISHTSQDFSESNQDKGNEGQHEGKYMSISCSTYSEAQTDSEREKLKSSQECNEVYETMQVEDKAATDAAETCFTADDATGAEEEKTIINSGSHSDQQLPKIYGYMKKPIRCKRPTEDLEELRAFNPRDPRFLPVEPDPEAEKVDLRHQMMDERKNAEEWMLDYALRQAVTKLAPARKRKVALLVEAFETVTLPKYESHLQHSTTAFAHTRPIQACS